MAISILSLCAIFFLLFTNANRIPIELTPIEFILPHEVQIEI